MDYYLRGIGSWVETAAANNLNHVLEDVNPHNLHNKHVGALSSLAFDACHLISGVPSRKRKADTQEHGEGPQSTRLRLGDSSLDQVSDEELRTGSSIVEVEEEKTAVVFDRWLEESFKDGPWFEKNGVVDVADGNVGDHGTSSLAYDHGIADLEGFLKAIGASEASSSL